MKYSFGTRTLPFFKKITCILIFLCLTSCDFSGKIIQLPAVRSCELSIRYQESETSLEINRKEVSIVGQFQSQDWTSIPLKPVINSEFPSLSRTTWAVDLVLPAGEYLYYLLVDGEKQLDPQQKQTAMLHGEEYNWASISSCDQGRWYRVSREVLGKGHWSYTLAYERAAHTQPNQVKGVALESNSIRLQVNGQDHPYTLQGEILTFNTHHLAKGKHHLLLTGVDQHHQAFQSFDAPFWVEDTPFRWSDGTMYQVVLDRFNPPMPDESDDPPTIAERWGGHLKQVIDALEKGYFEQFSVRSIWLSPLYANPDGWWQGVEGGSLRYQGYHGYWPIAARKVGSEWGNEEDLHTLVKLAHQKGIRVILDVVLNHVHQEHPYVQQYPDWFTPRGCLCGRDQCPWSDWIETCQFTEYLPDVRWNGTQVVQQQINDALWWIETFDLDGLRVDAVPMMPRSVIYHLNQQVKERFEGLRVRHLLLGETFTGPSDYSRIAWYVGNHGLDGQFNFPLMWSIRSTFAWQSQGMNDLVNTWEQSQTSLAGSASIMGNFIGNHDVTRFLSEAAGSDLGDPWNRPPQQSAEQSAYQQMTLAYAFIMSLAGISVLYYGDEIGMAGANDPDNRRPYWPWGVHRLDQLSKVQQSLFQSIKWLSKFRSCYVDVLGEQAKLEWLKVEEEHLSYVRYDKEFAILTTLQRQGDRAADQVALPKALKDQQQWYDVLMKEWYVVNPSTQLLSIPQISAYQFRFLVSQPRDCL